MSEYCKARVSDVHTWHERGCENKASHDNGFCGVHHPPNIEKRRDMQRVKDEIARKKSPHYRLRKAMAEIERLAKPDCAWTQDDPDYGVWEGDCGIEWNFIDDGPVENGCNFCPKCGGKLVIWEEEL